MSESIYSKLDKEELLAMVDAFAKSIASRVKVESQIAWVLSGKLPQPDNEKLKEWAFLLGVPEDVRHRFRLEKKDDS